MFSIFYGLLHGTMSIINGIDANYQTSINRENAKKAGLLTYSGARGNTYLVENGRQVIQTFNPYTKHEVIKDFKTGKIYYDLTEIKRKRKKEIMINQDKTTYNFEQDRLVKDNHTRRTGILFMERDIKTDSYLARININNYYFYMDICSGMLVRLSDEYNTKNYSGIDEISPEEIINIFNQRQNTLQKNVRYSYDGNIWTNEMFYLCKFINANRPIYINKQGKFVHSVVGNYLKNQYKDIDYSKIERLEIIYIEDVPFYLDGTRVLN